MLKALALRRTAIELPVWWPLSGYAALMLVLPLFWFPARLPLLTLAALPVLPLVVVAALRSATSGVVRSGLERPLMVVLLATCLAAAPVADWQLGLPKLLGMAFGAATLLVIVQTIRSRQALDLVLWLVALATLALSVVSLVAVEWTFGKAPILDAVYTRLPLLVRGFVSGTSTGAIHPNELAGVLVLLVPLALARGLAAIAQRDKRSITYVAVGLMGLAVLVLAQSRSGLIAIAVALSLLGARFVVREVRGQVRFGAVLAYCGMLAGLVVAVWLIVTRWLQGGTSDVVLDTFQGRLELWRRAVYMIQDVPLTGIGIGQFDPVLQALYPTFLAPPTRAVPHAHNVFLEYAVELGIPGAIAFGYLVIAALRQCWRAVRSNETTLSWSAFGLALSVLSFLLYGLADAIAPGARAGLALWIILGLAAAAGRISTNSQPPSQGGYVPNARLSGESP